MAGHDGQPHAMVTISSIPQDFIDYVLENFHAARGRELFVEKHDDAHDWWSFFRGTTLSVTGLTPTVKEPSVNHSWKFCCRKDVILHDNGEHMDENIANTHTDVLHANNNGDNSN